ncbi:MAG: glycogen/starch/alpha-glucan phosphorylase [Candidatus Parcubacteria bacterium]|nr:glycogen/starch/alpha-glucan phosphorylase [Candidatus Parcubacteria bacterium]
MNVKSVGYVTHEIAMMGLGPNGVELPQMYLYSGGLGTLAGAMARAARKLNVPLTVFSILARYGYYDQSIYEKDGTQHMGVEFIRRDYSEILEDTGVVVPVDICGKTNYVKAWKIPGKAYGTVDVYLLDTDLEINDELGRMNTRYLYSGPTCVGGNFERQIAQDIILGVGSVKVAERLGLKIDLWHMNESHTAPTGLYLLEKELPTPIVLCSHPKDEQDRLIDNAIAHVKEHALYTNHTPDPAGNARYGLDMFAKMYRGLPYDVLARLGDDSRSPPGFNMGAASLRLSKRANAVSKKHLEVTQAMFASITDGSPIVSITNGSLLHDFFQAPMFTHARTGKELERAKMLGKKMLNEYLRGQGKSIDIHLPVVVWARRFAQYKRPDMLLKYSRDWLKERLGNKRFQFVIAGKPHPDDHEMISAWTNLLRLSKEYPNLIMVPNYDMRISKILKIGADVWLNTPRVGMEACGTSGQSAAANGAINMSTIDGWMCEEDLNNFFSFGTQFPTSNMDMYDTNDEKNGLVVTMDRALDLYYGNQEAWYKMALRGKLDAEQKWNAERMMQEYKEKMYS